MLGNVILFNLIKSNIVDYEYLGDRKLLKDVVCISEVQDGTIEFIKK